MSQKSEAEFLILSTFIPKTLNKRVSFQRHGICSLRSVSLAEGVFILMNLLFNFTRYKRYVT